jgi:recombination protein RecT
MNAVVETKQRPFSVAIASSGFKELINRTLQNEARANRFVAAITSAVSVNPALQKCEAGSILSAALVGEALNLSPSPQLGQYYLVPFKKKGRGNEPESITAQFQIGYKGYIQLAIRSGFYKKINVLAVKSGELKRYDPLTEDLDIELIQDDEMREAADTTGYYAMFEYLNGFRKALYWSKTKMEAHAEKYSQAFNLAAYRDLQDGKIPQSELWKYSSFWYKSFDDMAHKTMLRQLISKWGIMSIELTTAIEKDMGVIGADGSPTFVDNEPSTSSDITMPQAKLKQDEQVVSEATEAKPASFKTAKGMATAEQVSKMNSLIKLKRLDKVEVFQGAGCTYNGDDQITVDQFTAVMDCINNV